MGWGLDRLETGNRTREVIFCHSERPFDFAQGTGSEESHRPREADSMPIGRRGRREWRSVNSINLSLVGNAV